MNSYNRFTLGPREYRLRSFAGTVMRLTDDIRKCVAFIGHGLGNSFGAAATGFFVAHDGWAYFVTNQHVAIQMGDDPYTIRINKKDGSANDIYVDPLGSNLQWHALVDQDVDLAVMPFDSDLISEGYNYQVLPSSFFLDEAHPSKQIVGIGDVCYAVGLFRLLTGKGRNLPFVHTGNIAVMPGDEKVPVEDWTKPAGSGQSKEIDCYLVELSNLKGLSGAPVFVRPTRVATGYPDHSGATEPRRLSDDLVLLLGVWSQSWDAAPGVAISFDRGTIGRVPIGVGCVVPAQKLRDLLDSASVAEDRKYRKAQQRHDLLPKRD